MRKSEDAEQEGEAENEHEKGGVPREQKMLKGHLPRVIYHQVYWYTKKRKNRDMQGCAAPCASHTKNANFAKTPSSIFLHNFGDQLIYMLNSYDVLLFADSAEFEESAVERMWHTCKAQSSGNLGCQILKHFQVVPSWHRFRGSGSTRRSGYRGTSLIRNTPLP